MPEWLTGFLQALTLSPHVWGLVLALPVMAVGLIGTVLPVLPGTLVIAGGCVLYGVVAGFSRLSPTFWVLQVALVGVSYLLDFLATAYGVRVYGGSRAAMWGALLGSLMLFVIGPLGLIVGPLAGAICGELLMGEQMRQAVRSGFGSFIGFLGGAVVKVVLGCIMIGLFLLELW